MVSLSEAKQLRLFSERRFHFIREYSKLSGCSFQFLFPRRRNFNTSRPLESCYLCRRVVNRLWKVNTVQYTSALTENVHLLSQRTVTRTWSATGLLGYCISKRWQRKGLCRRGGASGHMGHEDPKTYTTRKFVWVLGGGGIVFCYSNRRQPYGFLLMRLG
jgi:hypothetical protein